jgi:general secretion pathway protein G
VATLERAARLRLRLLISVLAANVVAVTAFVCAWAAYGDYDCFRRQQWMTQQILEELHQQIEKHREMTGTLPTSLMELAAVKKREVPIDEYDGYPIDVWGWHLQYHRNGNDFELFSLGADGQPGGVGLDADLYAGQSDPPTDPPTLPQFFVMSGTEGIKFTCLLAGLLTFVLGFLLGGIEPTGRPSMITTVGMNLVTAFFAIVTAITMALFHLPTGH